MAIQRFCEPVQICGGRKMNKEHSSLTLIGLPNELQERIVQFLDRRSLISVHSSCKNLREISKIRFCKIFFSKRCQAICHHSMRALINILQHPVFSSYVETFAFNLTTLATDVRTQGGNWKFTQSGVPEHLPATARYYIPYSFFGPVDSSYAKSMRFNMDLIYVLKIFRLNPRNKLIDLEINDHDLNHEENTCGLQKLLTEPGPKYYIIGYHTIDSMISKIFMTAQSQICTVGKLSLKLTNDSVRFHFSTLYFLGAKIRGYLRGEYKMFSPSMALHLAIGSGGETEHSLDYDPKSHSLSIHGLGVWHELTHEQLDARNSSVAMIEEIIIGGRLWHSKWLPTVTITDLELSSCSIPLIQDFRARFLPLISDNLQSITIRNTCLGTENAWSVLIELFASFKNLHHCCFINLSSATFLESLQVLFEEPRGAEFVDVVSWEHKGPGLKKGLWDLTARLAVAQSTWSDLSDDDDLKWCSGLGLHIVKGMNDEEVVTATE